MTSEDMVLAAVRRHELRIDGDGRIWRVRVRVGGRGAPQYRDCEPRRAENLTPLGYLQVRIMVDGVRYVGQAHRIVYRALVGEIRCGLTINHLNGNKADNRPSNLETATASEQAIHARHTLGRGAIDLVGERHPNSKLTDADAETIRARRAAGEELKAIAASYGVAFQTISKIARGASRTRAARCVP